MSGNVLEQHCFSSEDWVDHACREQLRQFLPLLLNDLRTFRPRLVFLSGSAALGEAVGAVGKDQESIVLSDLDIGVVTELSLPSDHCLPSARSPVKIGVGPYLLEDLPQQDPTLGTVDFLRHGLVLWGEENLLRKFPDITAAEVPVAEAVRLVGNRSRELLQMSNSSSIFALHRWAKLAGALYTADSVLRGCYESGWTARQSTLEESSGDRAIDRLARDWIPFLLRPDPEAVPPRRLGLLRTGLAEFFGRCPLDNPSSQPGPASAFLAIPTTLRQRLREWRWEFRSTGWRWVLQSRLSSVPENRRLGLAAAYWSFGPERPEPIWVDRSESEVLPEAEREGWTETTRRLWGRPLGTGSGIRNQVFDIVAGQSCDHD